MNDASAELTVVAPAFYPNPEHSTRYLRRSAARWSVPVRWYGEGEAYKGWLDVQLTRLLVELHRVTTRYVLYTDGSDAIVLAGLDEILEKYHALGSPELLMSVEHDWRVCAGGWMGWTSAAIDAVEWLSEWPFEGDDENPQTRWREAIEDLEIGVMLDAHSEIFGVSGPAFYANGRIRRIYNVDTGAYPCVFHWAGGYTDPVDGKAALIEPVWKELGYGG